MPTTDNEPPPDIRPPLPKPFIHSNPQPTLHYQGAEALLYRTTFLFPSSTSLQHSQQEQPQAEEIFPGIPAALKHRPSKPYRHPLLDAKLTRARILSEARVLTKLHREGISVPAVLALDWSAPASDVDSGAAAASAAASPSGRGGWMLMEWIEGETVRAVLDREELGGHSAVGDTGAEDAAPPPLQLMQLMARIGLLVAQVHAAGVIHGDLTTSNLMVRRPEGGAEGAGAGADGAPDVVLVDFGLAFQGFAEEDRAVDLYVLERAFGSSHPRTERLFREILRAYGEAFRAGKAVLRRLEEVRLRGRKKIMIG